MYVKEFVAEKCYAPHSGVIDRVASLERRGGRLNSAAPALFYEVPCRYLYICRSFGDFRPKHRAYTLECCVRSNGRTKIHYPHPRTYLFLLLFRAKLFGTPSFCCETTLKLTSSLRCCFHMLALGMPEDWQPPGFLGGSLANGEPRLSLEHRQRLWAAEQQPDPAFRTLERTRVSRLVTKRAAAVDSANAARLAAVGMGQDLLQQLYTLPEHAMVALTLHEAAQVEARATEMLLTIERKWLAVRATIDSIDKTDGDDATIDSIDKTDGDDAAGNGKIFCAMPRASMPPGFVRMASHIPSAALQVDGGTGGASTSSWSLDAMLDALTAVAAAVAAAAWCARQQQKQICTRVTVVNFRAAIGSDTAY